MPTIDLGTRPNQIRVYLARGGSFTTTMRSDAVWPPGVAVRLVFKEDLENGAEAPVIWAASISGNLASWDRDPEEVESLIDLGKFSVRLHYVEPDGSVLVWGSGEVNVL